MDAVAPEITVITAMFNAEPYVERLLATLAKQECDASWEYVIVDNGSTDNTLALVEQLRESFPVPITVVDGSARRNIPFVRNLGVARARADKIVFCDQDDIVQPGWLQAAYSGLRQHEAVMGLIRELTPDRDPHARVMNPSVFSDKPVVETCNFGARKEVLAAVGGYDEGLPGYGLDDSELALRLRKSGHEIVGFPDMVILARQTEGTVNRIKKVFWSAQGEIYVWQKHEDLFPGHLTWRHLVREGIAAAAEAVKMVAGRSALSKDAVARRVVTVAGHAVALRRLQRDAASS